MREIPVRQSGCKSLVFNAFLNNCIVQVGFLRWEIRAAFPRESQLRQSRATRTTMRAGCFSVDLIHRTLTWPTPSLTCTQMLIHAIAHGGVHTIAHRIRESVLKADCGRKFSWRIGDSNLRQRRAGPMLYQLSYTSSPRVGLNRANTTKL